MCMSIYLSYSFFLFFSFCTSELESLPKAVPLVMVAGSENEVQNKVVFLFLKAAFK